MSAVRIGVHDMQPESALAAILTHPGPVLLDLDETLYLRNSTEDFIDSARPALLALITMRLLDFIRPWRWTGGETTRDVWRIRCIVLLFPWTRDLWTRRVAGLATAGANTPLLDALKVRASTARYPMPIITTLGFRSIVTPLVAALGMPPQMRIVAARLSTFADRRAGKLCMVVEALGVDTVRHALVLTDSPQDDALLDACARPLRTVWPEARFRPALSGLYLPGQYLTRVKRPGERYITRGILQEDFALWILSSIALADQPIGHVLALLLLLLSFWAIYERGYVDNDRIAARYERHPKLSDTFQDAPVATPRWSPWAWSLGSGAIAVLLLRGTTWSALTGFAIWATVLLATHGTFLLYNRLDKATRIWLYAVLQFARGTAFAALLPVTPLGAMAIAAHVTSKWVPYYIYRSGGRHWPEAPHFLTRLLFFVLLAVLMGIANGFSSLWSWSAGALLAWNVYRARAELHAMLKAARRLDRNGPA